MPEPKIIVTVKLRSRELSDPKAALDAVRAAMHAQGPTFRALEDKTLLPNAPSAFEEVHQAKEHLEGAALIAAAKILELRATVESAGNTAMRLQEAIARRGKLRQALANLAEKA